MRLTLVVVASLIGFVACGHSHDGSGSPTLQACFDGHTMDEHLAVNEAIIVCCLDHPIGGQLEVCKDTAAECVVYVSAELDDASATAAEIEASCMQYITQRGL